jgi:hypothetical protein
MRARIILRNILYKRDLEIFSVFEEVVYKNLLFCIFAAEFVRLVEFITAKRCDEHFSASF